jgi:hypothetical protein
VAPLPPPNPGGGQQLHPSLFNVAHVYVAHRGGTRPLPPIWRSLPGA